MSALATSCLETPPLKSAAKTQEASLPVKPWFTREEMEALGSKQPLMSWEEKVAQINRSLGRPQGSP
jgi:hypothetical protein